MVALGMLQFMAKKPREQRPWKVEKIGYKWRFRVLQLPMKFQPERPYVRPCLGLQKRIRTWLRSEGI
jgi:hypothetical protein